MKHQTINLVKFKALSKRLRLPLCWTVGLLESLWVFACHNARDGRLVRFTSLELAGWMEYPGDEAEMVDALVETRWLDRDLDGHLSIHDWDKHKPNWLKGVESFGHGGFRPSSEPSSEPSSMPSNEPSYEPGIEPPNQTLPSPPKPNEKKPPPPQPNESAPDPEPLSPLWLEVVEVLFSEGMGSPTTACESARNRGVLPHEVMREVRHWQEHKPAWGVGLLYKIIATMQPERKVNWPEPGDGFVRSKSRADVEKSQLKTTNGRIAAEKERQHNAAEYTRLEASFGVQLDAMPKKDLRALVGGKFPAMLDHVPKRGPVKVGMLRNLLLVEMENTTITEPPHA